nr:MAG TPA: hypothetical protein [Caudoviricetes sp.]
MAKLLEIHGIQETDKMKVSEKERKNTKEHSTIKYRYMRGKNEK